MRIVIDIEANSLTNPTKIWVIVCKDIDTGQHYIFREDTLEHFLTFAKGVKLWIGHNILGYDCPVLRKLLKLTIPVSDIRDTLVVSKLANYSRSGGHALSSYALEFGLPKLDNKQAGFFSKWSQELEDYCVRDTEVNHLVYKSLSWVFDDPMWSDAIRLEQRFQLVVNQLSDNGFCFNSSAARSLLGRVERELSQLDEKIKVAFPPREELIREFTPKATKFGTISKTSVPRALWGNIHEYEVGTTYRHTHLVEFNPSSHKQLIQVLHEANWRPTDRTKSHVEAARQNDREKLKTLEKTGWKINEINLATLPQGAPEGARLLARRILLEARRRTLVEWLGLVQEDGRIHGDFYGIGAWTHRMAHQRPNTANVPNEFELSGQRKLYGKEMRALWCAPKNRLLVGVDAEGIQLRIFAHYIDDKEFTNALVTGEKSKRTDPHSLNQRVLGSVCKSRAAAKRFIFALLLGAGLGKLSEILEAERDETQSALDRLLRRYEGFRTLKHTILPRDGKRGFFIGLDGRKVPIPGETTKDRTHLAMSGYLQNGEAVVMKKATLKWHDLLKEKNAILVNFVHDEWQTECPNDVAVGLEIAKLQADSLRIVGEELGLKCPLAGSFYNDDHKDFTIGTNWAATH